MEQQPRLPLWFLVVNCGLIATAFFLGQWLSGGGRIGLAQPQSDALQVIYRQIVENHVEEQDGHVLLDRAITALAGQLDDYSRYVPPSEVKRYEETTTGRYEGVGMVWNQYGDDIIVHFPFAGGPADRAGVLPGDRLIAVDGKLVADLPSQDRSRAATELVRGPAETPVVLRFDRDGQPFEAQVQRDSVQRPAVKWAHMADPEHGLGYLHITDFHRGITAGVREAISDLERQGPLHGLIIDLRFDGGGSLEECIALARLFQPTGVIVSTRRRGAEIERVEAVPAECLYPDLPLVILVNADSASASEVLAGCLQDHRRASIVGVRTYGKGVVNTVYSWPEFKLKLTTAYYYTPNGRSLGGSHRSRNGHGEVGANGVASAGDPGEPEVPEAGIAPDVEAPATEEEQRTHFQTLSQNEVPPAHREAFAIAAEKYDIPIPKPPNSETDTQLARALEELAKRATARAGDGTGDDHGK